MAVVSKVRLLESEAECGRCEQELKIPQGEVNRQPVLNTATTAELLVHWLANHTCKRAGEK